MYLHQRRVFFFIFVLVTFLLPLSFGQPVQTEETTLGLAQLRPAENNWTTTLSSEQMPDSVKIDDSEAICKLQGNVRDSSGAAIPGATIFEESTGLLIETGQLAEFCISSLPKGSYSILAAAPGFSEKYVNVRILDEKPTHLEIHLDLKGGSETVTVQGNLREGPVRTAVISSRDIEQKGAVTLAEALDSGSGLRVESGCSNCNFTSLRINGLSGDYSVILMDGLKAFSSLDAIYGLEQLPTVLVEQIEVIKGGGSVLHGPGAVAGVVNVITRRPSRNGASFETSLNTTGASPGSIFRGLGSLVLERSGTSAFFFGNSSRYGAYDREGDGETETARRTLQSGGMRLFQDLFDESVELELGIDFSYEERRGGTDIDLAPHEALVSEEIISDRKAFVASWSQYFGPLTFYRVQFSHSRSKHDSYYGVNYDPNAYGITHNPATFVSGVFNHGAGSHQALLGFQFEREDLRDLRPGYHRRIEETYDNLGVFFQDDWSASEEVQVSVGLRADKHSSLPNLIFSPRSSVLFSPNEEWDIRGSLSYGYRPPRVYNDDLHLEVAGGIPGFTINSENLKEERALGLGLSSENILSQGAWGGFRIETNLFYNRLFNSFVLDEVSNQLGITDSLVFQRSNGGGSRVYGIEFTSDLQLTAGFDLEAGWTFQRSRLDEPEPEFGRRHFYRFPENYGYLTTRYTTNSFTAAATWSKTGSMWLKHYAGYIPADVVERTPSFAVTDARIEIPLHRGDLRVSLVGNLFNAFNWFQDDLDRGPEKHSGYVYGPRRPRTISLGLKFDSF